jgi:hypothetical protein
MIKANRATDDFCCAVMTYGEFEEYSDEYLDLLIEQSLASKFRFHTASFINASDCKEAYGVMCSKLKLVFQSEPIVNPRTGNLVFHCVFVNKD